MITVAGERLEALLERAGHALAKVAGALRKKTRAIPQPVTHGLLRPAVKAHFQVRGRGPAGFVRRAQGAQHQPAVQRRRPLGAEGRNQAGLCPAGDRVAREKDQAPALFAHGQALQLRCHASQRVIHFFTVGVSRVRL